MQEEFKKYINNLLMRSLLENALYIVNISL